MSPYNFCIFSGFSKSQRKVRVRTDIFRRVSVRQQCLVTIEAPGFHKASVTSPNKYLLVLFRVEPLRDLQKELYE